MAQMLASDLNNPEFVNPKNPDDLLHVEFYWHEPIDEWASAEQKREVRRPRIPFVLIMRAGDNTSIIRTPVRDDHKARWPRKWLAWQMQEGLIEGNVDVPGWRLEDWPVLTPEQLHEMKYLRFSTVEQLAGASDSQIQRLGMGGIGLRERARAALKEKTEHEIEAAVAERDKELAELRKEVQEMRDFMRTQPAPQPKRRGRPPKVKRDGE